MVNYNKVVREPMADTTEVEVPKMTETSQSEAPLMATIAAPSRLNIRKDPDMLSPILCTLASGDNVVIIGRDEEWSQVITTAGVEGYAMSQYIGPTWYE